MRFIHPHAHNRHGYEIDMLNGPVLPKLLTFAIPLILSSVLQLTFNAAGTTSARHACTYWFSSISVTFN